MIAVASPFSICAHFASSNDWLYRKLT